MMKLFNKTILTSCILLILVACSDSSSIETQKVESHHKEETLVELTKEQYETANIGFTQLTERSMSNVLKVNGKLDLPPQNHISISTLFGGTIQHTDLLEGMLVRKGQEVAVLQNPAFIEMQQNYLEYKSQLEYLKAEYERQESLSEINAKKTLQKAKSEFESMKAKMEGTKAKLKLLNISMTALDKGTIQSTVSIFSPINGYVTKVNTNIGQYVTPSDVLFRIADTEHLHAELIVFEKDVEQLKIGQKIHFWLANGTREESASIYLIGREIDESRSVRVHCHLDKENKNFLPGMYLTATIENGSTTTNAVDDHALVEYNGNKYVFAQSNSNLPNEHIFKMIAVKTGISVNGFTEIKFPDQLKGKQIVLKGSYDLLSKLLNTEEEGHVH